jgi:hypothetical protein
MPRLALALPLVALVLAGCGGGPRYVNRPDPAEDPALLTNVNVIADGVVNINSDNPTIAALMNGEDAIHKLAFLEVIGRGDTIHGGKDSALAAEFQELLKTALERRHRDEGGGKRAAEPTFTFVPQDQVQAAPSFAKHGDANKAGCSPTTRYLGETYQSIRMTQDDEWLSNLQRETGAQAFICASVGPYAKGGEVVVWIPYNLTRQATDRRQQKAQVNAMNTEVWFRTPKACKDPADAAEHLAAVIHAYFTAQPEPAK